MLLSGWAIKLCNHFEVIWRDEWHCVAMTTHQWAAYTCTSWIQCGVSIYISHMLYLILPQHSYLPFSSSSTNHSVERRGQTCDLSLSFFLVPFFPGYSSLPSSSLPLFDFGKQRWIHWPTYHTRIVCNNRCFKEKKTHRPAWVKRRETETSHNQSFGSFQTVVMWTRRNPSDRIAHSIIMKESCVMVYGNSANSAGLSFILIHELETIVIEMIDNLTFLNWNLNSRLAVNKCFIHLRGQSLERKLHHERIWSEWNGIAKHYT